MPLDCARDERLLGESVSQCVGNGGENIRQIQAERFEGDDAGQGNQGGNQAIFDGGGSAIVAEKLPETQRNILSNSARAGLGVGR